MDIGPSSIAIVTGGASGLGAATARALAAKGAKVAILDRDAALGEAVAHEIGGLFCPADIIDEASVERAFAAARAAHGQESVLICCAGLGKSFRTASRSRSDGSIAHFPIDAFAMVVGVNLIGTFTCVAKSAAGMLTREPDADGERGAIVMTGSVAAQDGQVGQSAYAASKAGIVGMTLPIARDLMSEGIRINTILPGLFDTPMMQRVPDEVKRGLSQSVPFPKRLGRPEEFARLALTMVETGYFNGETVRLDGAIRMAPR